MTTKTSIGRLDRERDTLTQMETDLNGVTSQMAQLRARIQQDDEAGVDDADARGRKTRLSDLNRTRKKLDKDFQEQSALVA